MIGAAWDRSAMVRALERMANHEIESSAGREDFSGRIGAITPSRRGRLASIAYSLNAARLKLRPERAAPVGKSREDRYGLRAAKPFASDVRCGCGRGLARRARANPP